MKEMITERLILSKITLKDLDIFHFFYSDKEINELEILNIKKSRYESEKFLKEIISGKYTINYFIIKKLNTSEVISSISFRIIDNNFFSGKLMYFLALKENNQKIKAFYLNLVKMDGFGFYHSDNFTAAIDNIKNMDEPIWLEMEKLVNENNIFNGKFVSVGYKLKKEYRGNGYAEESLRKIIKYLFIENNIYDGIAATVNVKNLNSKKLLEKCMFSKKLDYKIIIEKKYRTKITSAECFQLLKKEYTHI